MMVLGSYHLIGKAVSTKGVEFGNPYLQTIMEETKNFTNLHEYELLMKGSTVSEISGYSRKKTPDHPDGSLIFMVIGKMQEDVFYNESDEMIQNIKKLNEYLEENNFGKAKIINQKKIENLAQLQNEKDRAYFKDYEGLILRGGDHKYHNSRSSMTTQRNLKIKFREELIAKCIGWEPYHINENIIQQDIFGRVKRSKSKENMRIDNTRVGTLIYEIDSSHPKFGGRKIKVSSGYSALDRKSYAEAIYLALKSDENPIGKVAEIEYLPSGSKDKPRQPTFKRWVGDT